MSSLAVVILPPLQGWCRLLWWLHRQCVYNTSLIVCIYVKASYCFVYRSDCLYVASIKQGIETGMIIKDVLRRL